MTDIKPCSTINKYFFYLIKFMKKNIYQLILAALAIICCSSSPLPTWDKADEIVASIKKPVFKNKKYSVLKYGAIANGTTDCSEAFRKAIADCNKKGGGYVIVPKGKYSTGAIHLLSNVNLHLEEGAEILFSRDSKQYFL